MTATSNVSGVLRRNVTCDFKKWIIANDQNGYTEEVIVRFGIRAANPLVRLIWNPTYL